MMNDELGTEEKTGRAPNPSPLAPRPSPLAPSPRLPVLIRWLIRRDMPDVLRIEAESFQYPWTRDDFRYLYQPHCLGMVAEHGDRVAGFMVYALYKNRIALMNLAVEAGDRRRGVGTAMVNKLCAKLTAQRRRSLVAEVRETNLPAQLFLRATGFRAVAVLQRWFENTDEDGYRFRFDATDEGMMCEGESDPPRTRRNTKK